MSAPLPPGYVTVNIKLPLALIRRIDRLVYERVCAGTGLRETRSSAIRAVLEEHVPHYEEPPATTRVRTRSRAAA